MDQEVNKPFKGSTKDFVNGSITVTGQFPNRKQRRKDQKEKERIERLKEAYRKQFPITAAQINTNANSSGENNNTI